LKFWIHILLPLLSFLLVGTPYLNGGCRGLEPGEGCEEIPPSFQQQGPAAKVATAPPAQTAAKASTQGMHSALMDLLADMIAAYEAENAERFLDYVAADFSGDKFILDAAVQDDFSLFENIDLQVSISNFAVNSGGYLSVSLTYARSVTAVRSGRVLQDRGLTEMMFKIVDNRPRLYSMKNPLLFGLSDAVNVASGNVNPGKNGRILVVDGHGEARVLPFSDAMDIIEGGGAGPYHGVFSPPGSRAPKKFPQHPTYSLSLDGNVDASKTYTEPDFF